MSGKAAAVGAVNVQRKTWDKEKFAEKAKDRASGLVVEEEKAGPAPYRAAPAGLAGPAGSERAYLPSREVDLKLDEKLGKKRLVTDATPIAQVGGYFCELCQCTLRDSTTYLNHINGVRHQRRMGFSMRVERSTVDSVKARFAALKAQATGGGAAAAAAAAGGAKRGGGASLDAEDRYALAAMDHPDIAVVVAATERPPLPLLPPAAAAAEGARDAAGAAGAAHAGVKRGRGEGEGGEGSAAVGAGSGEGAEDEDDMAAMLGFSGFGGSKKR